MSSPEEPEGFEFRRPQPPTPYQMSQKTLLVPTDLSDAFDAIFRPYRQRRLEACCFLYGIEGEAIDRVVALVIPTQLNHWGNYHVPARSAQQIAREVGMDGLVNLSQVHTHPGVDTEHSNYDDQNANSIRALSIVLPRYGAQRSALLAGVGVHEWQAGYWHMLTEGQALARVETSSELDSIRILDLREQA